MLNRVITYIKIIRHLPSKFSIVEDSLMQKSEEIERLQAELKEEKESNRLSRERILEKIHNFNDQLNDRIEAGIKETEKTTVVSTELFAENHSHDSFYKKFEDVFRGSEKEIKDKLKYYLPYFEQKKELKQKVVDIGCGRGELLQLLKENEIEAIGVDINKKMIATAKKKGFDVYEADANVILREKKIKNIGIITGFHLVEHIPFDDLLDLLKSCYQALEKDGLVLFETPNPENLVVATKNFYVDPSHLKPIPPETLAFALEYIGFDEVKIERIHPAKESIDYGNITDDIKPLINAYYGSRDYVIIGRKS